VTITCEGENFIERVFAYSALDAMQCAILQFHASRNVAGKSVDGSRVMRVEPDFTLVKRPTADPLVADDMKIPRR
jgi:hypothetical protein